MKMLLRFIAFLFLLTISLGLVLVTITATETGSQWFIHWLIKTNDIPLTIESIEGRLLDKLTLSELHYSDPELNDISLGRLEFDWSVADLIQFEANVKKLALFDLVVRSQPEKKTDESFSFPTLAIPDLPVSLTIEALNLDKASIFSDDSEIKIQDFKSNLTLSSGKLTYKLEQLLVDEQRFNGSVHLIADVKPVLEVGIGWSGTINEKPGTGRLHLKGAQDDLAIDVSIDSAIELLLEGKLNLNAKTIAGELNGAIKGELFDSFSETAVLDSPLNLHIKGDMQHLSMQLDADAHTPAGEAFSFHFNTEAVLPESTATALNVNINWATISESDNPLLTLKGQGDFSLLDQILTIDHDLHMPDRINTSGKINLANNEIDMATDWEALVLSLSETSSLHLNAGLLKAAGKLDALSLLVQTQYALETKPETNSENESSEVDYASLSVKGQLNLLTAHPTGQLTGNINSPVPSVLANKLEAIELITFTLESDQDAADLNIDSRITTKTGHHYDAGLKSHLDLSANTSEKLIELNWFFISQDEQDVNNNVTGQGDIEYKPELISFVHQSNAPYASTLQGTVLLDDDTTLNLDLNWQDITLTLNTEQSFASERGAIHIEGPLASLTMTANARIDTAPVGTLDIDLDAAWSESVLTVKTLDIDVLDGKVEMNGVVNLEDGSKGHFELDARRLNFGKINSDLESQLMISSAINFTDTKAGLSSQLNISSIAGQWRGFPVKGAGELAYAKDSIQVVRLHLESGNNSLDLNLNMGESLQGLLDLSIQDLSVFSSDLAGNMQGRLDISGRPQTPRIEGKLTGGKIYISDVRLTSFVADAEIDLRPQQHSSLLLQLNALSYQNTIIDKVSISGEGLTEAHNIELTALSSGLESPAGTA
jgi:autotransporter translocation and assembly factor TamB